MVPRPIRCLLATFFLTLSCIAAHAQLNITEYLTMSYDFKMDLDNKTVEKNLYIKGVLDIRWYARDADLAITYDPYLTDLNTILRNMLRYTGGTVVYGNQKLDFASRENKTGQNSKDEQK